MKSSKATPKSTRRILRAAFALTTAAALTLTGCTGSNTTGNTAAGSADGLDKGLSANIDKAVETALQLSGSTQAIVGVWSGDKGYVRGYGENADSLNGNTPVRAAELTGVMGCALVLSMAEEGYITLDRVVNKDLRRQNKIDGVTYRQLCEQTSGIADFKSHILPSMANTPARIYPERELIAEGLIHSPLPWPGLDVNVSDTNGVLVGRALKIKTNQDLGELLADHVFQPAGLNGTVYPNQEAATGLSGGMNALTYPLNADATPQCEAGVQKVEKLSTSMLAGAGGAVSTVNDMRSFIEQYTAGKFGGKLAKKALAESRLIQNPERDKKGNPTSEVDESGPRWSFGVKEIGPLKGVAGSITGSITATFTDPASHFTVVIVLNNSTAGSSFGEILAKQIAAEAKAAGSGPDVAWDAASQGEELAKLAVCQGGEEQAAN